MGETYWDLEGVVKLKCYYWVSSALKTSIQTSARYRHQLLKFAR